MCGRNREKSIKKWELVAFTPKRGQNFKWVSVKKQENSKTRETHMRKQKKNKKSSKTHFRIVKIKQYILK